MQRRKFLGLTTAIGAGALAACAPPSTNRDGGGGSDSATTLNVWGWNQEKNWTAGVEAVTKSHPEVTINYRGIKSDEYNAALQTGLGGSQGPDVMMLRSYGGLETVVASGFLLPLGDNVTAVADFSPESLAGATARADGKLYGVPFAVQTADVIYNKEVFSEVGVDVPTTWEEFTTLCDKVKKAGKTALAMGFQDSWMCPIHRDMFGAALYGGPQFAKDLVSGAADFTDPKYTAANQLLLDLKRWMPDQVQGMPVTDLQTMFVSGQAAMYPGGIWELAGFTAGLGADKVGLFPAPPAEGDTSYAMGYVDGSWGISARISDEKKAAAFTLLSYLAGKEYGGYMADTLLQVPCVPSVIPGNELLAQATSWFAKNPTPYITYVNFDYGTPAGTGLEYEFLQKMMLGQVSAKEVGTQVQKGVSQWFKPQR